MDRSRQSTSSGQTLLRPSPEPSSSFNIPPAAPFCTAPSSSRSPPRCPPPSSSSRRQPESLDQSFGELLRSPRGAKGSASGLGRTSSGKRKARDYGDRFIPTREPGQDLHANYHLYGEGGVHPSPSKAKRRGGEVDASRDEANQTFTHLLKAEISSYTSSSNAYHPSPPSSPNLSFLQSSIANVASSAGPSTPGRSRNPTSSSSGVHPSSPSTSTGSPFPTPTTPTRKRLFNYTSPAYTSPQRSPQRYAAGLDDPTHDAYSVSPVTYESQRLLLSPRKATRTIAKGPFKVLDAPDLADDYYLNLVDWSSTNVLGVGLASCVYLWSANTSRVTKLCDLTEGATTPAGAGNLGLPDAVTSLNWTGKGNTIAVGTDKGEVQIWDAERCKKIRTMSGHTARVGSLAWSSSGILSSGSRDRTILHRDVRSPSHHFRTLTGHRQEVCGLKWNVEENQLASGGNDNKLMVWNGTEGGDPMWKFGQHGAAVKAIAWSPHQRGLLASGGGTADKKIRFWNTLSGTMLNAIDTGSQVCNLMWSKTSNELVSTHGFSNGPVQNQVCIWKYPTMSQVATLTGHTYRVLYLAMSPDGQTICTGAGDETLRFWNTFARAKEHRRSDSSALNPFEKIR